jgi:hypothetical protein
MARFTLKGGYAHETPGSLAEVEQDLWDWGIAEIMWRCAKSPKDEFIPSHHDFVETHYRKRNYLGQLVLGTKERARCWGWLWLRDHTDYPSLKEQLKRDPEMGRRQGEDQDRQKLGLACLYQ